MLGTIVNTLAVILGASIGLLLKRGIPEKMADTVMKGIGLCTIYIGITGALKGDNTFILILSMVLGAIIGEGIDLQEKLNHLGEWIERKFSKKQTGQSRFVEGFVAASLLFCVGAMAIVGSLQSGLSGNHEMLFSKSMLDFVAAVIFASSLGVGVVFSAALVFIYQGSITILAEWVAPYLTQTVINQMTCVGSVIIIGLAFNILGITKLKVMNFIPAIFLPILLVHFL